MILASINGDAQILSYRELKAYQSRNKGVKILAFLKDDYPSLARLKVSSRGAQDCLTYLKEKIKENERHIDLLKSQLKSFSGELEGLL